ncbi:MAG: hypothetical protein JNM28_11990 [Armatimonadetes bacterium]|nr:hypothetical protein [Armatimonadota bacterium]
MNDRVTDSILAAIAGVALGSPFVGRSGFTRLTGYSPIPHRMTPDTAFDAWLLWSAHRTEVRPADMLGQVFLDGIDDNSGETAYGLMNLRRGFGPPISGSFQNPLAGGSRGMLRAVVWGWLWHGDPIQAARHAYLDASIDHSGDGAWIPAALAFAVSSQHAGCGWQPFWDSFVSALPDASQLHRLAPSLLENLGHPEAIQFLSTQFSAKFPGLDRDSACATALFALAGLRHGGSAESAMLLAGGCGGAGGTSAGLAAAVGSWIFAPLPVEYIQVFDGLYVSTHALRGVEPPQSISEFAEMVAAACPEIMIPTESAPIAELEATTTETEAGTAGEPIQSAGESGEGPVDTPVEIPADLEPADPAETVAETADHIQESAESTSPESQTESAQPDVPGEAKTEDQASQAVRLILEKEPNWFATDAGSIRVATTYFSPPVAAPPNRELLISIKNTGDVERNLELALSGPDGWKIATALKPAKLPPGSSAGFPAVVQPLPSTDPNLRLLIDNLCVLIPLAAPQCYWALGPFENIEGAAYSQEFPPEKTANRQQVWDQPFSGRSSLGIRWQIYEGGGTEFDIEPLFADGPGVAYLSGVLTWPLGGLITVHAQFAGGLKLWVDNTQILSYNDAERRHHSHPQYAGQFTTAGESRILVKLVRGRHPVEPLNLTFYDESGRIVLPHTDASP